MKILKDEQRKIEELEAKLIFLMDIVSALCIKDIRNNTIYSNERKTSISIPYSFLYEVSKTCQINYKDIDDMLVLEPIYFKEKEKEKEKEEEKEEGLH